MELLKRIILFGIGIYAMSCSSIKFIPRTGMAAKLNLATVEYVHEQKAIVKQELVADITHDLETIVTDLLKNDRQTILDLKTLVDRQQQVMASYDVRMDSTNKNLANVAGKMLQDLAAMKLTTSDVKMTIEKLDAELNAMPEEVLNRLRNLLTLYLEKPKPATQN